MKCIHYFAVFKWNKRLTDKCRFDIIYKFTNLRCTVEFRWDLKFRMSFWSSCRLLRGGLQVRLISLINVILVEKSEQLYQTFKIIDNTYLRIIFSPFFRFLWIQMNCRKSYLIGFLNYRAKWDKKHVVKIKFEISLLCLLQINIALYCFEFDG